MARTDNLQSAEVTAFRESLDGAVERLQSGELVTSLVFHSGHTLDNAFRDLGESQRAAYVGVMDVGTGSERRMVAVQQAGLGEMLTGATRKVLVEPGEQIGEVGEMPLVTGMVAKPMPDELEYYRSLLGEIERKLFFPSLKQARAHRTLELRGFEVTGAVRIEHLIGREARRVVESVDPVTGRPLRIVLRDENPAGEGAVISQRVGKVFEIRDNEDLARAAEVPG